MNLIVAVDKNWAIGYKGKLLISIPEDMKFFRETTTGHTVVMGKNTLLSFPNSKPLKNRNNIVIALEKDFTVEGATTVYSIEEALEEVKKYDSDDVYVIGGGSIYKQLLPYCDKAYITYIDHSYSADTFFPNLDEDDEWEITSESEEQTYFDIEYFFRTYERKNTTKS
ncbi:dihydrofolate reductase [Eubacterium uniforme]|uniref:Dihydrofolate reductase n=1 Tax=Eubacterium uniforme TaxID=39495 RepID=A0A1T4V4S2_9FIRM|nr:dihydrofolate reductase [Eubacterium uniforme]SKA59872.1 dihydrofolate reductase [Eubacterium uniforme]